MKDFYSRILKQGLLFGICDFSIFKICSEFVNISVGHPVEECLYTLTCQIIMQQILLIFGENNTYKTLLGPTRLLISEKSVAYTVKWSYTIIWQVRVGCYR